MRDWNFVRFCFVGVRSFVSISSLSLFLSLSLSLCYDLLLPVFSSKLYFRGSNIHRTTSSKLTTLELFPNLLFSLIVRSVCVCVSVSVCLFIFLSLYNAVRTVPIVKSSARTKPTEPSNPPPRQHQWGKNWNFPLKTPTLHSNGSVYTWLEPFPVERNYSHMIPSLTNHAAPGTQFAGYDYSRRRTHKSCRMVDSVLLRAHFLSSSVPYISCLVQNTLLSPINFCLFSECTLYHRFVHRLRTVIDQAQICCCCVVSCVSMSKSQPVGHSTWPMVFCLFCFTFFV